jgi:hypothetical protein
LDGAKIDLKKKGVLVEEPIPEPYWRRKKGPNNEQAKKEPEIDPEAIQEWRRQQIRINNAQMIGEKEIEKVYERLNSIEHVVLPNPVSKDVKSILSGESRRLF